MWLYTFKRGMERWRLKSTVFILYSTASISLSELSLAYNHILFIEHCYSEVYGVGKG
jgi:hypothetical protein